MSQLSTIKNGIRIFKQALRGEDHDYTQGSISDAVILLAIPMIMELALESVFAIVDMFFVAKLGANAIATVGLTESVMTLVYSLGIGVSTGATAIVARRVGEKNMDEAAHTGAQAIVLSIIIAIFISIFGVIYADSILRVMGASEEVIETGTIFTQILMGGSLSIILLFLINGIFRGAGNAAMAMKSLWLASGVNIVLCPILIHFYGLKGAALATLIGRSSGVVYQVYHLINGKNLLRFNAKQFIFNIPIFKSLSFIATFASLQYLLGSGSWIIVTKLVAEVGGTNALAGCQIAFRSFIFFILPAWGFSNAAATLVGQNLGAQQSERAVESVNVTNKFNSIFMLFVTFIFLFFSEQIVRFFTEDESVIQYGVETLRILGSGFLFYGFAMIYSQAFNGAGDTTTPTWLNFVCFWLFQIPLAYGLALGLNYSTWGAIVSIPLSQILFAGLAWHLFKRGKWKDQFI